MAVDPRGEVVGKVIEGSGAPGRKSPTPVVFSFVTETFTIRGVAGIKPREDVDVIVTASDGDSRTFSARCRIDTFNELEYFHSGGILPYVLRKLVA